MEHTRYSAVLSRRLEYVIARTLASRESKSVTVFIVSIYSLV